MGRRARRGDPALGVVPEHTWIKPVSRRDGSSAFELNQRNPDGRCESLRFERLEELLRFAWELGGERPITPARRQQISGRPARAGASAAPVPAPKSPAPAPGAGAGRLYGELEEPTKEWAVARYYAEAFVPPRNWTEQTAAKRAQQVRPFLERLGGYRLWEFGAGPSALLVRLRDELQTEGRAPNQINLLMAHIKAVFATARRRGLISHDPTEGIDRLVDERIADYHDPDDPEAPRSEFYTALTPLEIERFRAALMGPLRPVCPDHPGAPIWWSARHQIWLCNHRGRGRGHRLARELVAEQLRWGRPAPTPLSVYVSVTSYAGPRPGEALGLRWGALGPDGLEIRNQAWGGRARPLKRGSLTRTVPIPQALRDDLEAIRPLGARANDPIFADEGGGFIPRGRFTYALWVASSQGGITFRAYDGRHTAASLWFHEGLGLGDVRARLGHRHVQTTINHYLRFYEAARLVPHVSMEDALNAARIEVFGAIEPAGQLSFAGLGVDA